MANDYWLDRAMRRMREGMSRPGGPMPDEAELIAMFDAWQRVKAMFTKDDVAMLRRVRRFHTVEVEETLPDGTVRRYNALTELADRIAALLPPNGH